MATKVYVIREKEVNGKVVKEYYNKESDVALKLKVNEDQPYVVYDDEKKTQLKGKELEAYIESHQDEFEEKEEVIDDNKPVNKLSVEIKDADNKYSYIFSNDDLVTRTLVAKGLKLDKSKEFTKQVVTGKMFKDAVKYCFQDNVIGHVQDQSILGYGIGNYMKAFANALSYIASVRNDKDTKAYAEHQLEKAKNKNKGYDRDEVAQEFDEMITEQAAELEEKAIEEGKDFDAKQYIMDAKREFGRLNKVEYIAASRTLQDYVDKTKVKEKLLDRELRTDVKVNDAIMEAKLTQLAVLSEMLGNGNPANAFEQFLDKKALEQGKFSYDQKAIDKFIKENFIKEKDLEKLAIQEYKLDDFKRQYESLNKGLKAEEEVNFEYAVEEGKKILKDGKAHLDNDYAKAYQAKAIANLYTKNNKEVYSIASVYNDLLKIREKRSRVYNFFHPINNRKEKQLLKEMKENIKSRLVEGTTFKGNIDDFLDSKTSSEDRDFWLDMAKDHVFDPIKEAEYVDNKKDMAPVKDIAYGTKKETEFFKDKDSLLQVMAEGKAMYDMHLSMASKLKEIYKDDKTLGFDQRDLPYLIMKQYGFVNNPKDYEKYALEFIDKGMNHREEFLNEYYDDFDKYDHYENIATDYESTKDKFLRYKLSQLNSKMLEANHGNLQYRKDRYEKDITSKMLFDEKTAIDSQLSFELSVQMCELTGINPNGFAPDIANQFGIDIYHREMNGNMADVCDYYNGKTEHAKFNVPDYFLFQESFNYKDKGKEVPQDYVEKFIDMEKNVDARDDNSVINSIATTFNNVNGCSGSLYKNTESSYLQTLYVDGKSLYEEARQKLEEIEQNPEKHENEMHTLEGVAQELLAKGVNEGKAIDIVQLYESDGKINSRIIPLDLVSSDDSFDKRFGKNSKGPYDKTYQINEANKAERNKNIMEYVNSTIISQINEKTGKDYKPGIELPQNKNEVSASLEKSNPNPVRQNVSERQALFEKMKASVEEKPAEKENIKENTKVASKVKEASVEVKEKE